MKNIIYCDFDGTITKEDTLRKFFTLFTGDKWLEAEQLWIEGQINSQECLISELNLIKNISQKELEEFLETIEIDEYFCEFYKFIKNRNYDFVILSDGFDLFIESVLKRYNLSDILFYSNALKLNHNRLSVSFPNSNPNCLRSSGTCKCSKITRPDFYYIGDGVSDVCIAKKAQTLFAKHNLKKYCDKNKIDYVSFKSFKDILNYFADRGGFNAKVEGIRIR